MKCKILYLVLFLLSFGMMDAQTYWGSGSRDLYPDGAYGGRNTLRTSTAEANFFPFPTAGTHYVYAKEGETIAIASSAQAFGTTNSTRNGNRANITLYGLDGNPIALTVGNNADTFGRIDNRNAEVAGPRFRPGTVADGNKYRALYYQVPPGGTGIYKVEFSGTGNNDADNSPNTLRANDNWVQGSNTFFIYAWDISVANADNDAWIPGRVYMNVFNSLNSNVNGSNWRGDAYNFYGKFVVHTRDGFMYEVDNNGNNGYRSTFMVNNKGFHVIGDPTEPSYQSIAASTAAQVKARFHDPRGEDNNNTFTHKIFYSLPDSTMPASSTGAVPGGSTWLHVPQTNLNIATATFEGVDGGTPEVAGSKGGHFVFNSIEGVRYTIVITGTHGGVALPTRTLTGYTYTDGENRIYWDGKDGNGVSFPVGITPTHVSLQLQGAEVHFPYIDMEINPNGIKLQQYNTARDAFVSDKVYWNDTAIGSGGGNSGGIPNPINASHDVIPGGTSSAGIGGATPNGHKWGGPTSPSNGSTFGNNQGMDTWTFARGDLKELDFDVTIKEADLKITNLSVNKAGNLYEGDVLTYTIGIKNDGGPSDTEAAMFRFVVPEGFVPTGVVYTFDDNSCGSEVVGEELSFDAATNSFVSHLNLPVDCEVTYTITVEITAATAPGNQQVQAGIMRPYDVYDPDATNTSDPQKPLYDPNDPVDITSYFYPPFDPFFEVEYNGLANSNNVDFLPANIVVVSSKDDINQVASGDSVKGNLLTNDSLVDEVIEVKFNGVSIPFNTETTLSSGGVTYGKITVQTDGTYVFEADPTFTGNVPPLTYLGENADSGINTEAHLYIEVLDEYIDDGSNNLPVAHLDTGTVKQEDTITINPFLNDFDIDNNTLSVTSIRYNGVSISSNPASPTTIVVGGVTAGTAYKDGYGNLVFEADKDFKGEIPFIYNVSDGRGGTASSTIIVNVIESDVIIDANDDAIAGLKGETVEVNILGNDTIEGTVDTVSLIVEDAAGNPVSVTAGPTDVYQNGVKIGSITLTVTGDVTFVPESNFVGSFNAPYTVCDTDANCSSSTVYFSILDGVRAKQDVCISGCNDNTFVKADDPNTIEYDNMIALFHSTLVKEVDGTIKVWGQGIGNNASGGMTNVLTPQPLNATNYPKLTGSILKIAGGSEGSGTNSAQFAVLTTDGLFIWGHQGYLVSTTIKNNSELDRVSIGTVGVANGSNPSYAKGLPEGVEPEDVKMLFGAYRTLVITTCEGKVWVLSYAGSKNGDGTTQSGSNNYVWHPVYKSTTTNGSTQGGLLEDVVATRGTSNALFALTSDGKLYTWGSGTYINNGAAANRTYATEVSVPFGITPKMIGMTQNSAAQSYYLLATDGRLYAMGNNGKRQLGIGNTTTSETWVQPQKPAAQGQGTGDLVNIAWISPNEHDYYNNANSGAAINVLTNDGKLWAWGSNSGRMIGGATNNATYDPIYMPGSITGAYNQGKLNAADVLMAVETGGHVSIAIKQCSKKYGYVGHKTNGSMGDGTNGSGNEEEYNFTDTVELVVCGAATSPMTEEEIYICPSDTTDLNDAILSNTPSGYTVEWWTTADRQPGTEVATPENVGAGTYYSFYIPGTGVCDNPDGSIVNVIELQAGDPGYADCGACYKPGKFAGAGSLPTNVGITSLRLDNTDGWPQIREGAWLALEANSKGFVPNRLTTIEIQGIPAANLVVGMMVYNSTEDCLQINIDGTSTGWKCFSKQGCLE